MPVLEEWVDKLIHKLQAMRAEEIELTMHFLQGEHTFRMKPLSDRPDDIERVADEFRETHGEPEAIAIVVPGYRFTAPIPETTPEELHQAAFEFGSIEAHPDREEIVSLWVSTPRNSANIEMEVLESGKLSQPLEGGELYFCGETVDLWSTPAEG